MANPTHYSLTKWLDDVPGIQTGTPFDQIRMNNIEQGILANNIHNAFLNQHANYASLEVENNRPLRIPVTLAGANVPLSVNIPILRNHINYSVAVEISTVTGTDAGDVVITNKQANGFTIAHTGAATAVTVICIVSGGMI